MGGDWTWRRGLAAGTRFSLDGPVLLGAGLAITIIGLCLVAWGFVAMGDLARNYPDSDTLNDQLTQTGQVLPSVLPSSVATLVLQARVVVTLLIGFAVACIATGAIVMVLWGILMADGNAKAARSLPHYP